MTLCFCVSMATPTFLNVIIRHCRIWKHRKRTVIITKTHNTLSTSVTLRKHAHAIYRDFFKAVKIENFIRKFLIILTFFAQIHDLLCCKAILYWLADYVFDFSLYGSHMEDLGLKSHPINYKGQD